jgi:hypothetical protein
VGTKQLSVVFVRPSFFALVPKTASTVGGWPWMCTYNDAYDVLMKLREKMAEFMKKCLNLESE